MRKSMGKSKQIIRNFTKYNNLLYELVKKNIKLKYRRSYLGILWTLIEPLLTMIVLTVVFGTFFNKGTKQFPVYVLTGRLLFSFFQSATKAGLKSVSGNSSMIKKVYVPKYIYVVSSVVSNFLIFLISLFQFIPGSGAQEAKTKKKAAEEAASAPTPAPVAAAPVQEADNSELIAVIAAAIAASEGTSTDGFVVRSIRKINRKKR